MTRVRHVSALALLFTVCCLVPAGAMAQPSSDVTLLTSTLPTLNPGQAAWVSTLWHGGCVDATSFQLTASGPAGVGISYPTNTGSYSSLYRDSTLLADDTDYAALKMQVGDSVVGDQKIALAVSYQLAAAGNGNGGGSGNVCNGNNGNGSASGGGNEVSVTRHLEVTLPVVAYSGSAVDLVTTSVGPVAAGSAQWVDVSYKANKPGVSGAQLTVTPPSGATVTYPNNGTSTSFASSADLSVGETDHASFRIDTGSLKPGNYTLGLDLAYGNGTHLPGSVTLVVS